MKLLAPNGKPSNLTPEQYKLVRTKAFKEWFGDWENDPANASKVVDKNGEPLVVYRGSKSKLPNYIPNKHELSKGIYFSTSKKVAELYTTSVWQNWVGRVFECFLKIKNIDYYDTSKFNSNIYQADFEFYNNLVLNSKKNNFDGISWDNFIDIPDLRNIFPNEPNDFIATTFIAFEPNQIKLADGTNTTFDSKNPDIRFMSGGNVEFGDGIDLIYSENQQLNKIGSKDEYLEYLKNSFPTMIKNGIKFRGRRSRYDFESELNDKEISHYTYYFTDNIRTAYGWARMYVDNDKDIKIWAVLLDNPLVRDLGEKGVYQTVNKVFNPSYIEYLAKPNQIHLLGSKKDIEMFKSFQNKKNYAGGGEVLTSPNGKPSNLTPEQYKLVRTKAFKEWFGDWENEPENASKVVDENGEPLVVYHNTENEFYVWDFKKINKKRGTLLNGAYFTNIPDNQWGQKKIPAFLNIREELQFDLSNLNVSVLDIQSFIKNEKWFWIEDMTKSPINTYKNGFKKGIIFRNTFYSGNVRDEYVVFKPNQIKLADGTNTTFDSNNPDIRYEKGGNTEFIYTIGGL